VERRRKRTGTSVGGHRMGVPVSRFRQRRMKDLNRQNYLHDTIRGSIWTLGHFANYLGSPLDLLGAQELRLFSDFRSLKILTKFVRRYSSGSHASQP